MNINEKMDHVADEVLERLSPFGVTQVKGRRHWDGQASMTAVHPGIGFSSWYVSEVVHEEVFLPDGPPVEVLARRFADEFARELVRSHQRFVTARLYPDSLSDWCIGDYINDYRIVAMDRVTNMVVLHSNGEPPRDAPAWQLNEWLLEDGSV